MPNVNTADGKLRFNTDSKQLFVEYDTTSDLVTDIVSGLSETQIRLLPDPLLHKFYLTADKNTLMYFNEAIHDWIVITSDGEFSQAQADWSDENPNSKSYIKNKPTIDMIYDAASANAQSGLAVDTALQPIQNTISTLLTTISQQASLISDLTTRLTAVENQLAKYTQTVTSIELVSALPADPVDGTLYLIP